MNLKQALGKLSPRAATVALSVALSSLASAQTAAPAPASSAAAAATPSTLPPDTSTPRSVDQSADTGDASDATAPVTTMDPFTVDATTGQSYGASNSASATRVATPIGDIPQTISVVNANLLQDEHAWSFDQAVRYVPGVTQRQNSPDGAIIRGLSASSLNHYEDGYYAPSMETDMSDIDRIEIIKGPSASIAGASESTGLINYITKKPQFTDSVSDTLTFGSWDFVRDVFDATGPVPGINNLAYRVDAYYVNSDTYRTNERIKKVGAYPSFIYKLDAKTTLFVKVDLIDNLYPGGYETPYLAPTYGATATKIVVPANAKIQLNQWGPLSFNSSGFPGMDREDTFNSFFIDVTHEFTDWLSVRQSAMYYSYQTDHFFDAIADNMTYDANGNLLDTFQVDKATTTSQSWRFQGDASVRKDLFSDMFSVRGLAGYEIARTRGTQLSYASANNAIPIMINAPDYSQDVEGNLVNTVASRSEGGSQAVFTNLQFGFYKDMVLLMGGIRYDQNKASWTDNTLNNTVSNTPTTPTIKSPIFGLTVKPLPWISLFGVHSNAGAAATTISTFPGIPTTDPRQILRSVTPDTINTEFGAKFTFFHENLAIDVSHFDTTQSNISRNQTDPSYPGGSENFIDSGNHTKGIEVDWAGNITKQLSIFGGYVNDMTQAPGEKPHGGVLELRGTPRDKVQMFLRYDLMKSKVADFGVFGGVVHQTSVWGRAADTYIIPGATRYDAGFDYHHGNWTFAVGVVNITDKIFPAFAVGQGSNTTDDPRNFYVNAGIKF